MTRHDFDQLAEAMRRSKPDNPRLHNHWVHTVEIVAAVCARHNLRFNHDQFATACGIKEINHG